MRRSSAEDSHHQGLTQPACLPLPAARPRQAAEVSALRLRSGLLRRVRAFAEWEGLVWERFFGSLGLLLRAIGCSNCRCLRLREAGLPSVLFSERYSTKRLGS